MYQEEYVFFNLKHTYSHKKGEYDKAVISIYIIKLIKTSDNKGKYFSKIINDTRLKFAKVKDGHR